MSYNKCHTDIGYENEPSVETPLNETNLNYTDHCVDILDDRVVALDVAKLAVSEANSFITNITMNDATGIFTITKRDGTSYTIDTKLEKIAVNFRYDSATQKLIITLSDGTTQEVDLSSLITENEFTDSTTIAFTVVGHNVSATVKAGSITDSMLESGFLAAAQAAKSGAELAKSGADASALKAEGFAVGQQGGIDVPSTSPYHDNNAKYYAEQAETSAANAANSEDNASDYASAASTSATNASNSASAASTSAGNASTSATNASNSADAAADSATEASEYATSASGSASTATSKASEAGGYATSANDSRLESEGYAVGTQDGVDVPSTSPYYHNNAKYYAQQSGGQTLAALNDVSISNPQSGESLVYDPTTQKWVNGEASIDVIDNLTSTSTTDALSANQGRVLDQKKADSGYPTDVLPSAYQRVEFLKSHGTEGINTGYIPKSGTKLDVGIRLTSPTGNTAVWGCADVGTIRYDAFCVDSKISIRARDSSSGGQINNRIDTNKHHITVSVSANSFSVGIDGNTETVSTTFTDTVGLTSLWIFTKPSATGAEIEITNFEISEDDEVVRNFIPCYRISDNEAGLYDTVNDVFYDNDGTGTFGVGADVVPKTLKEVDDAKVNISDIVNDLTHTDIDKPLAANQGKALDGKITDLKFLGWSVPKECPIQNYMDSNRVFHQRVGRVDLGTLSWERIETGGVYVMICNTPPNDSASTRAGGIGAFCAKYATVESYATFTNTDKTMLVNNNGLSSAKRIAIHDSSYTDATTFKTAMQGVYLYYELATEILHNEGSEIALYRSNRNLLDNSWFTVNQRGVTKDTWSMSSYGLDRWLRNSIVISSLDSGITFKATSGDYGIYQYIEKSSLPDGTYTLSAIVDGIVHSFTTTLSGTTASPMQYYSSDGKFTMYITNSNNNLKFNFNAYTQDITIKAVKLELGGVSTLANDTAPNYAEELLKCQRYFQKLSAQYSVQASNMASSYLWVLIPSAIAMRIARPSLIDEANIIIYKADAVQSGFSVTDTLSLANWIGIKFTKSSHGLQNSPNVFAYFNNTVYISADL